MFSVCYEFENLAFKRGLASCDKKIFEDEEKLQKDPGDSHFCIKFLCNSYRGDNNFIMKLRKCQDTKNKTPLVVDVNVLTIFSAVGE